MRVSYCLSTINKDRAREVNAKLEAFPVVSAVELKISWNDNVLEEVLRPPEADEMGSQKDRNDTNYLNKNEFKQIIINDHVAYIKSSTEWKRVNFIKFFDSTRSVCFKNMEEFVHNSFELVNISAKLRGVSTVPKRIDDVAADLHLKEIMALYMGPGALWNYREHDRIMYHLFDNNFHMRMYSYTKDLLPLMNDWQKQHVLFVYHKKDSVFDKLQFFGYKFLFYDHEAIDRHSLRMFFPYILDHPSIDYQVYLAMEFFPTMFAENAICACNENFRLKNIRMDYTTRFRNNM